MVKHCLEIQQNDKNIHYCIIFGQVDFHLDKLKMRPLVQTGNRLYTAVSS